MWLTLIKYIGLWNKTCHFDFFRKNVFHSYERARRVGHKTGVWDLKNWPLTFKNSWRSKGGPKIAKFFRKKKSKWQVLFQSPIYCFMKTGLRKGIFFNAKKFFHMNFASKTGCKNEFKDYNEKSFSWSRKKVSQKINFKAQ